MAENINISLEANKINLSKGAVAIVSSEDWDFVAQYKWSAVGTKNVYAVRSEPGNNRVKVYLAREILARKLGRDLRPGEVVCWHSPNTLDCRRENLEPKQRAVRK